MKIKDKKLTQNKDKQLPVQSKSEMKRIRVLKGEDLVPKKKSGKI